MSNFLITGTDTGVGKTLVACGIAAALDGTGRNVGVFKPVETGCRKVDGHLYPSDASLLAGYSGTSQSLDEICPFRYEVPLAPSVAARMEQRAISLEQLKSSFNAQAPRHDLVIVEGAGGLLVPIFESYTFADLALDLSLPVVLVVGSKLGALNHAMLTLECLAARSISLRGYVLNHPFDASDDATRTNPQTLSGLTDAPCLGILPFLNLSGRAEEDLPVVRDAATRHLDLHGLLGES